MLQRTKSFKKICPKYKRAKRASFFVRKIFCVITIDHWPYIGLAVRELFVEYRRFRFTK